MSTRRDLQTRYEWQTILCKMLYEKGYVQQDILKLWRFVDWLLVLPPELEQKFQTEMTQYEEEKNMVYRTVWEQEAIRRGNIESSREFILETLAIRFGEAPDDVATLIEQIDDLVVLKMLPKQAIVIDSLTAFQQTLAAHFGDQTG